MPETRRWMVALAATALSAGLSTTALADEFANLCVSTSPPVPGIDRLCACVSGRLSGAERAAATNALRAMRDAQTRGAPLDPTKLSADISRAIEGIMAAMMQCAPTIVPVPPRSGSRPGAAIGAASLSPRSP